MEENFRLPNGEITQDIVIYGKAWNSVCNTFATKTGATIIGFGDKFINLSFKGEIFTIPTSFILALNKILINPTENKSL